MSLFVQVLLAQILANLATKGITDITTKQQGSTTNIFGKVNGKDQLVGSLTTPIKTDAIPYDNVFTFFDEVSVTQASSVKDPDLEIDNPFGSDCILLEIDYSFDANMSLKGGFASVINSQNLITDTRRDSVSTEKLTNVSGLVSDFRPNGQNFRKDDKLKIYVTSDGTTTVKMQINATFAIVS